MSDKQKVYFHFKALMDILIGILLFLIMTPLFLVLGIMIKLESKGPVFFKQKRIGRFDKEFTIYKFRTMRMETPKNIPTHKLENPEQWITKIGHILRKTSLDELPQVINILKGEMSFIGPRPALWNQVDLIKERNAYEVQRVKPGITGLAQIQGRDALKIKDKARLDGTYIKLFSLKTDIKILFNTVKALIKNEGVIEGGTHSMGINEEDI